MMHKLIIGHGNTIRPSYGHWRSRERNCTLIGTGVAQLAAQAASHATDTAAHATVTAAEAQTLATETQNAKTQTQADEVHFALLFKKLDELVHPANIDFAGPFRELKALATVIKANCLPDQGAEDELMIQHIYETEQLTGDNKTKMELLQRKVKRVSEESAKVSASIGATIKGLDEYSGKPADEAADVKKHLNRLRDISKDVADALARAQNHLKDEASTIETRRKEFKAADEKLSGLKAHLKSTEEFQKNFKPSVLLMGMHPGSGLGYSLQQYIWAKDIERLRTQIKSQEGILKPIKDLYDTATKDKSTYDAFVKSFGEEHQSLDGYITQTESFYTRAEQWRDVFAVFGQKWRDTSSQVDTVVKSSKQLQTDLDHFLPQCAIFSKHVLNVVNQGSFFSNRPGLLELLLTTVQELENANNLTGPDEAMHELKIGIDNERLHLLEVKKQLDGGHYKDHEMPQPLNVGALYKKV